VGDLRNKIAKIERDKAEKAAMEAWLRGHGAAPRQKEPELALPRCACGNTWNDVPVLMSYKGGYWETMVYYCPGCCPPRFISDMLRLTVDDPSAYLPEDPK
jgi:hypothetical protein